VPGPVNSLQVDREMIRNNAFYNPQIIPHFLDHVFIVNVIPLCRIPRRLDREELGTEVKENDNVLRRQDAVALEIFENHINVNESTSHHTEQEVVRSGREMKE
jgi:hypothetical protein